MRRAGVDPATEAQLSPIRGGTAMIAAMEHGQIDGFCLSSPTSDIAVQRAGATYLFNMATNPPAQLADFPYIGAAVTQETAADARLPQLTAYCRGIALALKPDPGQTRPTFKTWAKGWFEGMPDALFDTSFDNNLPIYQRTPMPTEAGFRGQHRLPRRGPEIPRPDRRVPRTTPWPRPTTCARRAGHATAGLRRALAIEVQGVSKHFIRNRREVVAIDDLSLTIEEGEFVALVGPSGCGKSTLLNMIAGILDCTGGTILHDGARGEGREPPGRLHDPGGQPAALAHGGSESCGCRSRSVRSKRSERAARAEALLEMVNLKGFGGHFPNELSGGMRKRVALAQVLAYDPGTLLMDEPFGALDAQLKLVMQEELLEHLGPHEENRGLRHP